MMIETYPKYFQKSLFFLYPLLEIRGGYDIQVPKNSYLILEGKVSIKDYKLICVFKKLKNFENFEKKYILKHKLLLETIELENPKEIMYIFDLSKFKYDVDRFLEGKYTHMRFDSKMLIKNFYSPDNVIAFYIISFLFPEKHYETYSKILNVPIQILEEAKELADIYDEEKETCKIIIKKLDGI